MNKNYDLLNGLFSGQKKSNTPVVAEEVAQPTTKRTFKILNEPWEDFLILASLKGKTQAELINALIEQAVADNTQEIERYKKLFNKNK